ncbi:MAG: amidohydrolase family protein [Bifidobacterium tibiigranuli]|jgi:N-acyl-D-amino-acid deacylase|nr:amidohydrolase family protein [Bifidobacterium tibiigranuli]MCI1796989.1 amidohydrolase family protein [Bifidobacterium tibiigranuli]
MKNILLQGGTVISHGFSERRQDVLISGSAITEIGSIESDKADCIVDCSGKLIMPGFVDMHSHADGAIFNPRIQKALLRQGVTTIILGQDGVSYAPGDGRYASHYFAALDGPHPNYQGFSVADLLKTYKHSIPLNIGYMIPAGTVRNEVMGSSHEKASEDELGQMTRLICQGMDDGALGMSSGLDYVPGRFSDTDELGILCRAVAGSDGVYMSHMRGNYEENSQLGIDEIIKIFDISGARMHVSHFHARAALVEQLIGKMRGHGIDATFDMYPYTRGCTLLGMVMLPPEMYEMGAEAAAQALNDDQVLTNLLENWVPNVSKNASLGPDWPNMITVSHVANEGLSWAQGKTLAEIADNLDTDAARAAYDLLKVSNLEVSAVMAVKNERSVSDLSQLFNVDGHMGGSDGIYIGDHLHPRAYGCFAEYLGTYVRKQQSWDWSTASKHLSYDPVQKLHLGKRGSISVGSMADVIVVDPKHVQAKATYENPMQFAEGIEDVFVSGVPVLEHGDLTGKNPGAPIYRGAA